MSNLIVLLPAKNEEKGIGEVIRRIPEEEIERRGFNLMVVVVDGHSSDRTCEIANELGARVIHQTGSRGKGEGVREALSIIKEDLSVDKSLLIMLDADATYSPEDIPRFIDHLEEYDVVWGSRMRGVIEKDAMTITNWIGNKVLSLTATTFFFRRTTDLCTGFWSFRNTALGKISLTADGFNLEADLFGSVVKSKLKTFEIPIDYAHREGDSNLRWYYDGPRIMLMIVWTKLFRKIKTN